MKQPTINDFYRIISNIKLHQNEMKRLNNGLSLIMNEDIYSDFGGTLLDSYIDLAMEIFNDQDDLLVWFIYENEFGENGLTTQVNGQAINISNVGELFNLLERRRTNG